MKKLIIFITTLLIVNFYSCKKDNIDLYQADNYIYFNNTIEDSTIYSFSLNPGKTEDFIPFEVKLIGQLSNKDRTFSVSIIEEETTATQENYEVPSSYTFHANKVLDTIYVKIKNTEKLKENSLKLVLELNENEEFLLGPTTNLRAKIIMNDMLSKPNWWDTSMKENFLGDYSEKKYKLFIQITGIADMTDMGEEYLIAYSLQFKYYLQEQKDKGNEILEEDGSPMTVTVVG